MKRIVREDSVGLYICHAGHIYRSRDPMVEPGDRVEIRAEDGPESIDVKYKYPGDKALKWRSWYRYNP